ncbi:hypothetical protein [Bacillus mycoides]|uniref:hypothetical protein n=1 Tax=Bacillus mycoides TaxID=1405 RepID=UPI003A7F6848
MNIESLSVYILIWLATLVVCALVLWFTSFVIRTKFGSKKELTNTDYNRIIKYMNAHKVKECGINHTVTDLVLHNEDIGVRRTVDRKSLFGVYTEEYTKVKGLIK